MRKIKVTLEVSARHLHLCPKDFKKLFGAKAKLHKYKNLSQEYHFAAKETLAVIGPKGVFQNVRIVGPLRKYTQLEICYTDAVHLGLKPPVRKSGSLAGAPSIILQGPKGKLKVKNAVILVQRHLHASPEKAKKYGLKDGQTVSLAVSGKRGAVFHNVQVRVHLLFKWHVHLDTDEANAVGLFNGKGVGYIGSETVDYC